MRWVQENLTQGRQGARGAENFILCVPCVLASLRQKKMDKLCAHPRNGYTPINSSNLMRTWRISSLVSYLGAPGVRVGLRSK
jgi:hypothetical protein